MLELFLATLNHKIYQRITSFPHTISLLDDGHKVSQNVKCRQLYNLVSEKEHLFTNIKCCANPNGSLYTIQIWYHVYYTFSRQYYVLKVTIAQLVFNEYRVRNHEVYETTQDKTRA